MNRQDRKIGGKRVYYEKLFCMVLSDRESKSVEPAKHFRKFSYRRKTKRKIRWFLWRFGEEDGGGIFYEDSASLLNIVFSKYGKLLSTFTEYCMKIGTRLNLHTAWRDKYEIWSYEDLNAFQSWPPSLKGNPAVEIWPYMNFPRFFCVWFNVTKIQEKNAKNNIIIHLRPLFCCAFY